jgi:hypothetical protein
MESKKWITKAFNGAQKIKKSSLQDQIILQNPEKFNHKDVARAKMIKTMEALNYH